MRVRLSRVRTATTFSSTATCRCRCGVELRALADDLTEGRVSPAEYDRLVEELLVAIGVPVAEAED